MLPSMGSHPVNLALRFILELSAIISVGAFAWTRFDGVLRWVAVLGLPLVFMGLWGVFAVPDDPSRSGSAPVATPGMVRLLLEIALFAAAYTLLYLAGWPRLALALGFVTVVHCSLSWDRLVWLSQH
jgi:hypothetical protein